MSLRFHVLISAALIGLVLAVFSLVDERRTPPPPSAHFIESVKASSMASSMSQQATAISVYLIGSPSSDVLTPARFAQELASHHSTTEWQEVLTLHGQTPINALIVDSGSYGIVDWQWVADRVGDGIVVVGVNVPLGTIAPLVTDAAVQGYLSEVGGVPVPPSAYPGDRVSILAAQAVSESSDAYFGLSDEYVNHPQSLAMGEAGELFFRRLNAHLLNLLGQ